MRNIPSLALRRFAVVLALVGVLTLIAAPVAQSNISKQAALDRTFDYAKHVCVQQDVCKRYAANRCIRHSGGVSCLAWNYLIRHGNKFVCKRLVFWKSRFNREFLTDWKCYRGWNRGPYATG